MWWIPKQLSPDQMESSKKLAVVTILDKDDLRIIDMSGHKDMSLGRFWQLEAAISVFANKNVKSSLGGDPDSLKKIVKEIPVLQLFNEYFEAGFDVDIETVYPEEMNSLNMKFEKYKKGKGLPPSRARKDYRKLKKELDVDLVMEIKFVYGLAAYGGGVKPTAAVAANVRVIETNRNKIIMMKKIISDASYREGYTVDEFLLKGADMFESELIAAIKSFIDLVATDFGAELSLKRKSFWNSEK